ncbi:MAG: SLBB domain-containing protein [Ignavibacteriales bacterium]|nr:SLBB domain-containing protein [Ignavibacteriales bacterium]
MKLKILSLIIFIILINTIQAQIKDYELGADVAGMRFAPQGGYFNYSDPEAVNIKVAVWGWIKYPGKYTVPSYTSVSDLLSLAGGPTDGSDLEDLRIYRVNEDSTQSMIKFNYNDLLYESKLQSKYRKVPKLDAGDILVIPGEPRLYFRDHFSIWMSLFSVLISLTILVLNIIRK